MTMSQEQQNSKLKIFQKYNFTVEYWTFRQEKIIIYEQYFPLSYSANINECAVTYSDLKGGFQCV